MNQFKQVWTEEIQSKSSLFSINFNELWYHLDLLLVLLKLDFITFYRQTILGPIWFFVQPILTSLIYIIIFGQVAKLFTDGILQLPFYFAGITIGNDVWIGAHSVILGGTTIGDGAVIAANSVVTKDIAPYAIVAGTPAKIIGFRFEEDIIDQLLQLQWWHWTAEEINSNKAFFENELTKEILQGYLKSVHI